MTAVVAAMNAATSTSTTGTITGKCAYESRLRQALKIRPKLFFFDRATANVGSELRPELKGKNIDILAALPGPIDTDMVKDLPMPKSTPADVAKGVLAGVERGEEDIFPDPTAQQMGALWNKSHKEYERAFASF